MGKLLHLGVVLLLLVVAPTDAFIRRRRRCGARNGGWSAWNNPAWTDNCGTQTRTIKRSCNSPAPNSCGARCSGASTKRETRVDTITSSGMCPNLVRRGCTERSRARDRREMYLSGALSNETEASVDASVDASGDASVDASVERHGRDMPWMGLNPGFRCDPASGTCKPTTIGISAALCQSICKKTPPSQPAWPKCGECIGGTYGDTGPGTTQCTACPRVTYSKDGWSKCMPCTEVVGCAAGRTACIAQDAPESKCSGCSNDRVLKNDGQQCFKSCSFKGMECFPGSCSTGSDVGRTCTCAPGFEGTNCRRIKSENKPVVLEHIVEFCDRTGAGAQCVQADADGHVYVGATTVADYGNNRFIVAKFQHHWKPALGDAARFFSSPPYIPTRAKTPPNAVTKDGIVTYITDMKFGVAGAAVRVDGYPQLKPAIQWNAKESGAPTRDAPHTNVGDNTVTTNLGALRLADGLVLPHVLTITNGGYVEREKEKNYLTNPQAAVLGNTGADPVKKVVFDFTAPVASGDMLQRQTQEIATSSTVTVKAQNWADAASGMKSFQYVVCPMHDLGANLDWNPRDCQQRRREQGSVQCPGAADATIACKPESFTLPAPGLYVVVLHAFDKAMNVRDARRFVLYDNNPAVTVSNVKHVKVTSAGNNGNPVNSGDELWQATNGKFTMDWEGVFSDRENRQWYKPIRAHFPAIGKAYDEPESSKISEVGTAAHTDAGITKYQWSLRSQTAATPNDYSTLRNPLSAPLAEKLTLNNLNLPEGHLWTFSIEAWNIFGEAGTSTVGKAIKTVDFLVDTTAPDVEIEGLTVGLMTGLQLHDAADLRTMKFAFKAGDDQSALKLLTWTVTEDVITDGEACTVCTPERNTIGLGGEGCDIEDQDCLCTPHGRCRTEAFKLPVNQHQQMSAGEHGRGYTFAITATNRAGLQTTKSLRIVIDTTPPTVGAVFDGADPSFEVDFQMPRVLKGSWTGFNDPESGIRGYRYLFTDTKVTEVTSAFSEEITDNFAAPTEMAEEGRYYLCVVAINNALSMSKVRCSDGVMTDQTPPEPPLIRLAGSARVSPGIAKDKDGKVWMIYSDMTRQAVSNAPQACADKVSGVGMHAFIELPGSVKGEVVCSDGTANFSPKFYQSSSTVVAVNWECATPMEELREFEVGISPTSQGEPTLRSWKTVGLKTDSLILHGKLDKAVYVQVKAVKFTGAFTINVIGPIFIDSTTPTGGSVSIAGFPSGLQVTWSKFSDSESNLVYEVGAGTDGAASDNVVSFRPAKDPANLCSGAANCGSVEGHEYGGAAGIHGVVRACNLAGLCRVVASANPTTIEMKPVGGRVFDLQSTAETTALTDIAYQTSTTRLYVVPSGFTGGNLKFQYAVGTTKGGEEVATFKNAGALQDGVPLEIQATLAVGTTYYTTIKASNSLGFVTGTSNGVMPLGTGARPGGALVVHDGQGCASGGANLVSLGDRGSQQLVTSVPGLIQTTLHVGHKYTIRVKANAAGGGLVAGGLELSASGVTTAIDAAAGTAEFVALEVNTTLALTVPASKPSLLLDSVTVLECTSDVSAQRQTDQVSVWWSAPDTPETKKAAHVQYYQHAVDVAGPDGGWIELRSFTRTAESSSSTIAMQLQAGAVYRSRVRACHPTGCYTPASSNGVQISEMGPAAGNVMATYTQAVSHDGRTSILINWQAFSDYGAEIDPVYQWAVASDSELANFVTEWSTVTPDTADTDDVTVHYKKSDDWTYQLEATVSVDFSMFDAHDHLYVAVRGFGNSGITTVGVARAEATSLLAPELRVAVVDLESEMDSSDVRANDVQYTKQHDSLAAAWPSLWPDVNPDFYHWSLSTSRAFTDCANITSPMCGRAAGKTVEAKDLELVHGQRYYFCVKAGISTLNNGVDGGVQEGSDDTSCSNGVTVDLTPATAGEVLLGYPSAHAFAEHHELHPNTAVFQQSNSELVVRWHGFVDVEEFENAPHVSGIETYTLMIGSAVGVGDVWGPKNVGGATHEVVRGLNLKSGETYYATVVATDYAGWETTSASRGVTVDRTPPGASVVVVAQAKSGNDNGATAVTASWTAATDAESGIVEYLVGVGSSAGSAEIVPFRSAGRSLKLSVTLPGTLPDGHPIVVTVKAVNGVGVARNSASHPILVDSDGPIQGVVVMVDPAEAAKGNNVCAAGDISCTALDFQATANAVALSWSGFDDIVGIQSFSWAVGTTPGGTDVHGYHQVSPSDNDAIQVAVADKLELADGSAYYASVRACDLENRCTVATSAPVVVDATPPVAGRVLDGYGSDDADFQADMNVIGASWEGFHDPHSHISRYEWCAGLSRGACDVVPSSSVGLLTSALATNVAKKVNVDDVVYITVYAYNGAGLLTSATSDGMHMDDKPGSITAALKPIGRHPSAGNVHAQSSRSVIEVSWQTSNFRAGPLAVWYSIASHSGSSPPVPVAKRVYGDGDVVTGLQLVDGDTYFITAVACDGADVCSVHKTEDNGLLIDGSAPHHNGWGATSTWKWTANSVTMSWAVCTDPHSEVSEYTLTMGTEFGTSNVAYETGIKTEKGTTVATETDFSGVAAGTIYFATLTCRNAAGMPSNPIHAQVEAITGGQLRYYPHSCQVVGCDTDRQCSCGATSESCPGAIPTCAAPPAKAPVIAVKDGFDDAVDASVQYDSSALRAHWSWNGWKDKKQAQVRLQYAIFNKGTGLRATPFKSLHRDWQDLPSRSTSVVYVAPEGENFTPGQTYEFHFRVWFSHSSYATHKSTGILIAPAGPQLSRTTRLKESVDNPVGDHDGDHTGLLKQLSVTWAGTNGRSPVFYTSTNNQGAAIEQYEVAVGSLPGALDLSGGYRKLGSSDIAAQGASVKGLSLEHGQQYWVSVRATDATGIHKVASTDGIRVDRIAPIATSAVVSDGRDIQDLDFQLPTTTLAATWSGFSDPESGIAFYRVGHVFVPSGGSLQSNQLPSKWRNVGLENSAQVTPETPLATGTYYTFVKATNLVGMESAAVKSDGVVVDGTPPVAVSCGAAAGSNLASSAWAYVGNAATAGDEIVLPEPTSTATQEIKTKVGTMYTVSFSARVDVDKDTFGSSKGVLTAGPGVFSFLADVLHVDPVSHWRDYTFQFVAGNKKSEVRFAASRHASYTPNLHIKDVVVAACKPSTEPSVHAGPPFQASFETIAAQWSVDDEESGIDEFQWAIGTIAGGEQLQTYTSVGRNTHASTSQLVLAHGMQVYVTVLATNGAGVSATLSSSTAVTIDQTPPAIGIVSDSGPYQFNGKSITARWADAADVDSGLSWCEYAVGNTPGAVDVLDFARTQGQEGVATDIKISLPAGKVSDQNVLFVTVRCANKAGLVGSATSEGVRVLLSPPTMDQAIVEVSNPVSLSVHGSVPGVQSVTDSIVVSWAGFGTVDGMLLNYEVQVRGAGVTNQWLDVGSHQVATITDLKLAENEKYAVAVRATDGAGRTSDEKLASMSVDTTPPVQTKVKPCAKKDGKHVKIDFAGVFSDKSDLRYEVSVGKTASFGDQVMRVQVDEDSYRFLPQSLKDTEYFLTLTAIDGAGHTTTMRTQVEISSSSC